MDYLWPVAGCGFGFSISLFFSLLLFAIVANLQSAADAVKAYTAVFGFLLGGGGFGAYLLFESYNVTVFYILGLAVGFCYTYFKTRMSVQYTLESVRKCVVESELLRDKVPNINERVLLIATQLASIKSLARHAKKSESEVEEDLSKALDTFSK